MSTFKSALALCGLSQSEASLFLGVSKSSIDKWNRGVSGYNPPEGVWVMLADRMRSILEAADYGADHMSVEGIDPRAWSNISVSLGNDNLDSSAEKIAGAMSLMMAIDDRSSN